VTTEDDLINAYGDESDDEEDREDGEEEGEEEDSD